LLYPLAPMVAQPLLSQLRREGIELNVAILPSAPAIARHLRPGVSCVRRTGAGIEIESRQSAAVSALAPLLPMAGLLAWHREARVHEARVEVAKAQAMREDALVRQQAEQHARREAETERTWVSITENGDKPGTALVLIEKAGKATGGKFYILAPEHPRDFSKGKGYNLGNVRHEGKTIKADVSVIDGSSTTGTKDMHLTITLKETLKGDEVQAEVQEGNGEKQPIVFVCEKGGRQ